MCEEGGDGMVYFEVVDEVVGKLGLRSSFCWVVVYIRGIGVEFLRWCF